MWRSIANAGALELSASEVTLLGPNDQASLVSRVVPQFQKAGVHASLLSFWSPERSATACVFQESGVIIAPPPSFSHARDLTVMRRKHEYGGLRRDRQSRPGGQREGTTRGALLVGGGKKLPLGLETLRSEPLKNESKSSSPLPGSSFQAASTSQGRDTDCHDSQEGPEGMALSLT